MDKRKSVVTHGQRTARPTGTFRLKRRRRRFTLRPRSVAKELIPFTVLWAGDG